MGASRQRRIACVAMIAWALVACDVVLGLNDYSGVPCAFDCGVPLDDGGGIVDFSDATHSDATPADAAVGEADAAQPDAPADKSDTANLYAVDAWDAGAAQDTDAAQDADASQDADAAETDAPIDADADVVPPPYESGPYPTEIWAHWPMPNPEAAIGPESSTLLPHPMTYDASTATVADLVTSLTWQRDGTQTASDHSSAQAICAQLGAGWRLPTRIELVSLIDFTEQPVVVNLIAFPSTMAGAYWTSSIFASDGGEYWTVSFSNGSVNAGAAQPAEYVRCVQGGS